MDVVILDGAKLDQVSEVLAIPGSRDELVMLDYLGDAGVFDNVRRYRPGGEIVWRAAPPGPAPDGWEEIDLTDGVVTAKSRSGWEVCLDLTNGAELSRVRYR
jgi:hypothetical protein